MASVTRDSALYAQIYTNKYLTENAYQLGGRAYPIAFQHTVVSGEAGGASAGVSDIVNLCVLPKDVMVVALDVASDNIWASVGVTGTYSIGDSGQVDRYMKATKSYTAGPVGGPIATQGDLRGGRVVGANRVCLGGVDGQCWSGGRHGVDGEHEGRAACADIAGT